MSIRTRMLAATAVLLAAVYGANIALNIKAQHDYSAYLERFTPSAELVQALDSGNLIGIAEQLVALEPSVAEPANVKRLGESEYAELRDLDFDRLALRYIETAKQHMQREVWAYLGREVSLDEAAWEALYPAETFGCDIPDLARLLLSELFAATETFSVDYGLTGGGQTRDPEQAVLNLLASGEAMPERTWEMISDVITSTFETDTHRHVTTIPRLTGFKEKMVLRLNDTNRPIMLDRFYIAAPYEFTASLEKQKSRWDSDDADTAELLARIRRDRDLQALDSGTAVGSPNRAEGLVHARYRGLSGTILSACNPAITFWVEAELPSSAVSRLTGGGRFEMAALPSGDAEIELTGRLLDDAFTPRDLRLYAHRMRYRMLMGVASRFMDRSSSAFNVYEEHFNALTELDDSAPSALAGDIHSRPEIREAVEDLLVGERAVDADAAGTTLEKLRSAGIRDKAALYRLLSIWLDEFETTGMPRPLGEIAEDVKAG
ncbi:hypothetical protein [Kiritimatiella glycovorans]|uniref:Uncharacterized protein n=1 Tax=Kiritimatiella glycovorans TaxID=1307763 RepID=A0A0G3EFA8_9BACT|nr:hypothetical protein [Kiritimatiella glycovorans]AKJ63465.1 hypothetical protein L21SP4_00181 [Kiritimatiella glycovorans]